MDRLNTIITKNVRDLIEEFKMTQEEFADYCDIRYPTLQNLISNKQHVTSLRTLHKIATACEVDIWSLLMDSE